MALETLLSRHVGRALCMIIAWRNRFHARIARRAMDPDISRNAGLGEQLSFRQENKDAVPAYPTLAFG